MSIILRLIEEKNNQLLELDAKKEERERLVEQVRKLDEEIVSFEGTLDQTLADVDELTDCAIKLGLLPDPKAETDDAIDTENSEEIGV